MKFRLRRALAIWIVGFALFQLAVPAEALRAPFPGKMNNLMVRTVQSRAARMGLAANDPRIAATVAGMSSAATDLAVSAGVALVAGTPIGWGGIIITAALAAGVSYCLDTGCSLPFTNNGDGSVSVTTGAGSATSLRPGATSWFNAGSACDGMSLDAVTACHASWLALRSGYGAWSLDQCFQSTSPASCRFVAKSTTQGSTAQVTQTASFATHIYAEGPVCASGAAKAGSCFGSAAAPSSKSAYELAPSLPAEELTKPASPDLMAKIANRLWKDGANKPGYAGLPYSMTDPVTTTEMEHLRNNQSQAWPTVGDLTAPVSSSATAGSTVSPVTMPANGSLTDTDPAYTAEPATGTNPSTQPVTNLGSDPGTQFADPNQDTTADMIISPLFNWFPSTSFNFQLGGGMCPTDDITVFGEHFTLDQHCAMLEQWRAALSAMFLVVWTCGAAVVLLRS